MKKHIFYLMVCSLLPCAIYSAFLATPYDNYLSSTALKIVLFCLFPLLYSYKSGAVKYRDIFKLGNNKKVIGISLALGIAVAVLIIFAFVFLREMFNDKMILASLADEGIHKNNFIFVFINIIFINALLEEIFFRGFVFCALKKAGDRKTAYIYSAVLFAAYHILILKDWFAPAIFILCMTGLTLGGVLFNKIYEKCGGLLGGYLIHVGANLGINLIGLYLFLNN